MKDEELKFEEIEILTTVREEPIYLSPSVKWHVTVIR